MVPNTILRRTVRWPFALILAAVTIAGASGGVSAQIDSGPVAGSNTSTIRNPGAPIGDLTSYGKPNQSRIWFNSAQNRWDAVVPRLDTDNSSDHYILTDVPGSQTFTSVELARRDFARPDAFWDDANQLLYVLASHPVRSWFWRVGYDEISDTYAIDVGTAGNGVAVPGITHPNTFLGGSSPATLYVTPNGSVWVADMANGLQIQHSSDGGASWRSAPVTLDAEAKLGVTTWIDFEFQGRTFVGVFAAENGETGAGSEFFFWYIDQNDDPTVPGNWIDDSANIPAPFGVEQSDDHVSAAVDSDGNQYFAVKTEGGGPDDPLIRLFKRTPDGAWSAFSVTQTDETPDPEQSRPLHRHRRSRARALRLHQRC